MREVGGKQTQPPTFGYFRKLSYAYFRVPSTCLSCLCADETSRNYENVSENGQIFGRENKLIYECPLHPSRLVVEMNNSIPLTRIKTLLCAMPLLVSLDNCLLCGPSYAKLRLRHLICKSNSSIYSHALFVHCQAFFAWDDEESKIKHTNSSIGEWKTCCAILREFIAIRLMRFWGLVVSSVTLVYSLNGFVFFENLNL